MIIDTSASRNIDKCFRAGGLSIVQADPSTDIYCRESQGADCISASHQKMYAYHRSPGYWTEMVPPVQGSERSLRIVLTGTKAVESRLEYRNNRELVKFVAVERGNVPDTKSERERQAATTTWNAVWLNGR